MKHHVPFVCARRAWSEPFSSGGHTHSLRAAPLAMRTSSCDEKASYLRNPRCLDILEAGECVGQHFFMPRPC